MKTKLPEIAPCPCGCLRATLTERTNAHTGQPIGYYVRCNCGWFGPFRSTKRGAILAWNRRASETEAERRGAMAALGYLDSQDGEPFAFAADALRLAIECGEVAKC